MICHMPRYPIQRFFPLTPSPWKRSSVFVKGFGFLKDDIRAAAAPQPPTSPFSLELQAQNSDKSQDAMLQLEMQLETLWQADELQADDVAKAN